MADNVGGKRVLNFCFHGRIFPGEKKAGSEATRARCASANKNCASKIPTARMPVVVSA